MTCYEWANLVYLSVAALLNCTETVIWSWPIEELLDVLGSNVVQKIDRKNPTSYSLKVR